MTMWQAILIAAAVLIDQVLDKITAISAWFKAQLSWSQRKSVNMAILVAVLAGAAIYLWPVPATAQAPVDAEFEVLGAACSPQGAVRVVLDVTKPGLAGIEIPPGFCASGTRVLHSTK